MKLPAVALMMIWSSLALGQQPPKLSKHAEKIRKQVAAFAPGSVLVVKSAGRPDLSGSLISASAISFDLEESSTHQDVSLKYENVGKIKTFARKYGRANGGTGRTIAEVGGGAVILGLVIYLIVALHSGA